MGFNAPRGSLAFTVIVTGNGTLSAGSAAAHCASATAPQRQRNIRRFMICFTLRWPPDGIHRQKPEGILIGPDRRIMTLLVNRIPRRGKIHRFPENFCDEAKISPRQSRSIVSKRWEWLG